MDEEKKLLDKKQESENDSSESEGFTLPLNYSNNPTQEQEKSAGIDISLPVRSFLFPGEAASPPNFISLDQVIKAASGFSNMVLAHEIAVDGDFKLQKIESKEKSLQSQVKDVVHKAFWDVIQEEINDEPPHYEKAMVLLEEVKEGLLTLLLPHHSRLRIQICETLDIELIRQQAVHGTLDFRHYADYVISVMSRLCAPVRDEKIKSLKEITEVVALFKGILEMLDLMKLDMANYTIQQVRPHIQQHSIEYERKKFQEYLEFQTRINSDGLQFTKEWLKRIYNKVVSTSEKTAESEGNVSVVSPVTAVLTAAYLELLEWNEENNFPETLIIDQARLLALRDQLKLAIITASILLVTYATLGETLHGIASFKETLKNHITVLLEGTAKFSQAELKTRLESVGLQVIKEVDSCLQKHGYSTLSDEKEQMIAGQILEISSSEHSVCQLIKNRIMSFVEHVISSATSNPVQVPPGLSVLRTELTDIAGHFLRLVVHNRAVFGEYYVDIINSLRHEILQ